MKLIYNPTGKTVDLTISGEHVVIPSKNSVMAEDGVGEALQNLLPGLEFSRLSEKEAERLNKQVKDGIKEQKRKLAEIEDARLAEAERLAEEKEERDKKKEKKEKKGKKKEKTTKK